MKANTRRVWLVLLSGACLLTAMVQSRAAAEDGGRDAALWQAIASGGAVVLMRHALAPGTGDPEGFVLGDCTTQRNLSAAGRQQALDLGRQFRRNGVEHAEVYSSQWCRCLETAELLNLGEVQELPAINSFFQAVEQEEAQTGALRRWLALRGDERPAVLVTHQVNITALTGIFPASGEMVVLGRGPAGTLEVLGRLATGTGGR